MFVPSITLLIAAVVIGAGFFWDIGGFATVMRRQVESQNFDAGLDKRLPSWVFRTFGAWCFVFGIGQFLLIAALTR